MVVDRKKSGIAVVVQTEVVAVVVDSSLERVERTKVVARRTFAGRIVALERRKTAVDQMKAHRTMVADQMTVDRTMVADRIEGRIVAEARIVEERIEVVQIEVGRIEVGRIEVVEKSLALALVVEVVRRS